MIQQDITKLENGYSICFNEWALDKEIKNELGLLLIISSLCAKEGYCYASNEYLSMIFNEPEQTISRKIKKLKDKNYITIEYEKRGCEVIKREIRLTKMLIDGYQKCEPTVNKNVKDNNISINNISNNIEKINKKEIEDEFEELWNMYPRKQGKKKSLECYLRARKNGTTYEDVKKGIDNYNKHIDNNKTKTRFIKQGDTWFRNECWNDEYESEESYLRVLEREWGDNNE